MHWYGESLVTVEWLKVMAQLLGLSSVHRVKVCTQTARWCFLKQEKDLNPSLTDNPILADLY